MIRPVLVVTHTIELREEETALTPFARVLVHYLAHSTIDEVIDMD